MTNSYFFNVFGYVFSILGYFKSYNLWATESYAFGSYNGIHCILLYNYVRKIVFTKHFILKCTYWVNIHLATEYL